MFFQGPPPPPPPPGLSLENEHILIATALVYGICVLTKTNKKEKNENK